MRCIVGEGQINLLIIVPSVAIRRRQEEPLRSTRLLGERILPTMPKTEVAQENAISGECDFMTTMRQ